MKCRSGFGLLIALALAGCGNAEDVAFIPEASDQERAHEHAESDSPRWVEGVRATLRFQTLFAGEYSLVIEGDVNDAQVRASLRERFGDQEADHFDGLERMYGQVPLPSGDVVTVPLEYWRSGAGYDRYRGFLRIDTEERDLVREEGVHFHLKTNVGHFPTHPPHQPVKPPSENSPG